MRLLAIDPGSNKCGIAFFHNGKLYATETITTEEKDPVKRRYDILQRVALIIQNYDHVVSEAPVLMGMNNNGMQRFLGVVEYLTKAGASFIHPMTIKSKIAGTGKADKLELALAAGAMLDSDSEKEIMADIISRGAFDEGDAVAVGLTYLQGQATQ